MIEVLLPEGHREQPRRAAFYLALEEWVARELPPAEYCLWWVVRPTVVFGRNQDMKAEVNGEYCRSHGIDMIRRRSGGGCIYADGGNVMTGFVTPSVNVESTFARFTALIAARLRAMGIDAEATGRNDITVGGRKISGNSFYHLPGRSIVHGTMLYDTDMENMLNAITPSRAKLESKQVQSVSSRIVTARELRPDLSFEEFRRALSDNIADAQYVLTPDRVAEVERLEQRYYDPAYFYGSHSALNRVTRYIPGTGTVGLAVTVGPDGTIAALSVSGDFMDPDAADVLCDAVRGRRPDGIAFDADTVAGVPAAILAEMIAESAALA